MKVKYIFTSIKVINGEYEYTSRSVHQISSRKSINKFGRDYVRGFYGGIGFQYDSPIDPYGYWYFNGGEVACRLNTAEEITKEEYDVLNKFIWR